jgi:hypothetical protein
VNGSGNRHEDDTIPGKLREIIKVERDLRRQRLQERTPIPHIWLCVEHFTERADREGREWFASVHALQRKICAECGRETDCLPFALRMVRSSDSV